MFNLVYYSIKEGTKKRLKVSPKTLKHIQSEAYVSLTLDDLGNIFVYNFSRDLSHASSRRIASECFEITGNFDGATLIDENRIVASRKGVAENYVIYKNLMLDDDSKITLVPRDELAQMHLAEKMGHVVAKLFQFNAHHDRITYMMFSGRYTFYMFILYFN